MCLHGPAMLAATIFRIRGARWIYDPSQPITYVFRSTMWHCLTLDFMLVGFQHAFRWETMPLYFSGTHYIPIVQCWSRLENSIGLGIRRALASDFR